MRANAFTLIELLVVIAVVAILAALLVFFTTPVSFTAATIALLIFVSIFVGLRIYQMQYFPGTLDKGPIWAMGIRAVKGGDPAESGDDEAGEDEGGEDARYG